MRDSSSINASTKDSRKKLLWVGIERLDLNLQRYVRQFLGTVRAFAVVTCDDFIGRFHILPFIEDRFTFSTDHPMRHPLHSRF